MGGAATEAGIAAEMAYTAACQWARHWLDTGSPEAVAMVASFPDRTEVVDAALNSDLRRVLGRLAGWVEDGSRDTVAQQFDDNPDETVTSPPLCALRD